jgi:DNA helicase-2/ATP-dependent DNA helicase PcrA
LIEDLSAPVPANTWGGYAAQSTRPYPHRNARDTDGDQHWSYEDEDQRPQNFAANSTSGQRKTPGSPAGGSIDNIAQFFSSRGQKFPRPQVPVTEPSGKTGFRSGQRVRHPKYGEGVVFKREGDGENAKITVQFPRFGIKKLVEKFAQLERV